MKRKLLIGVIQWLAAGFGAISVYLLTLDTFSEWDWFTVIKGAVAHVSTGLAALALFIQRNGGLRSTAPVDDELAPQPDYDQFDDAYAEPAGLLVDGVVLGSTPLRRDSGFTFSRRSLSNRAELTDFMQRTATRGLKYSPHDWVMVEAGRTLAEQALNIENGVSKTLESRHVEIPAQAFDFYVFDENNQLLDGTKPEHEPYYLRVATAIRDAARDEGGSITSGVLDWGWDYYHIERSRSEVAFKWPAGLEPDVNLPEEQIA